MKNLSDEFVISIGLLLMSFFIFHVVIFPSIIRESNVAVVSLSSTRNIYNMTPSDNFPGVFNFNYKYEGSRAKSGDLKKFDFAIVSLDEKKAYAELPEGKNLGVIRDTWGYPVKENAFMKTSRIQDKKNGDGRADEDPDVPGLVNCRSNEGVTGYFKAYFEDVALENGVGYDDLALGEGRREEVCQVLQDIAALIKLDETDVTPEILFTDSSNISISSLAAASAYMGYYSVGPDNGSLHRHIISRNDPTPGDGMFDAFVMTNFTNVSWDVDSDLNTGTYDFYTVIYHEIMHALGFRGLLPATVTGSGVAHQHDTFDYFSYKDVALADPFIDPVTAQLEAPVGAPSPWYISNNVVYRGIKNLIGALPDDAHPVYSPVTWEQGASLSHFDMSRASGQTYVMNPSIATNTERDIHIHEKEVLCHLGYQVEGVTGCLQETPFAVDDIVDFEVGDSVCIKPLVNDEGFAGQVVGQSLSPISLESGDNLTYYSGADCTGSTATTFENARSVLFDSASVDVVRTLRYEIKDTVSNRISNQALIVLSSCGVAAEEYLCNGDFESGYIDTGDIGSIQVMECPSVFPDICPFWGSPDIYNRDFDFTSYWLYQGPTDTHNGAPNNRYLFGGGSSGGEMVSVGGEIYRNERAYLKTKAPLPPGEYIISWYGVYAGGNLTQVDNASVNAYITSEIPITPTDVEARYISNPEDVLVNVPVDMVTSFVVNDPTNWRYYETTLTIPDNNLDYEYLILEPKRVAIVETDNFGGIRNVFDDVSIRLVSENLADDSVTGIVYEDENQDGVRQNGETALGGVSVHLFDVGSTTPLQTVVTQDLPDAGAYGFSNISDGTYNVALDGESLYSIITEPLMNNIIPGYSHARQVVVSNGVVSSGNDFGVVLGANNTDFGSANLHIKKALIDSSLSIIDRNITWQVEVTNFGPDTATAVNIIDAIPVSLEYYAHATNYPYTYNPVTGIWQIPELGVGETAYINITMRVPQGTCGLKTNMANILDMDQTDSDTSDNTAIANIKLKNCATTAPGLRK